MRLKFVLFAIVAIILIGSQNAEASDQTTALKCKVAFPEKWGNWTSVEGDRVKGPLVSALSEIFEKAPAEMIVVPRTNWRSVLDKFSANEIDILATAIRFPAREKTMHFVGPLMHYYWAAFKREGETLKEQPKVGVNRVLVRIEPVPTIVARLGAVSIPMRGDELMPRLASGDVQMVLGARSIAFEEAKALKLAIEEVEGSAVRSAVYLGVNKDTACAKIAPDLNAAIRSWRMQGGEVKLLEAASF